VGQTGEFDGVTSQGKSQGMPAEHIYLYRVVEDYGPRPVDSCDAGIDYVFQARDSRRGRSARACPFGRSGRQLSIADIAQFTSYPTTGGGGVSFNSSDSEHTLGSRYKFDIQLSGRLSGTTMKGSFRADVQTYSSSFDTVIDCKTGPVSFTAHYVSTPSPVFSPGGQGYPLLQAGMNPQAPPPPNSKPAGCYKAGRNERCTFKTGG